MTDGVTVVAGGGVAGLSSALLLARSGRRVLLLERDPVAVGAVGDAPDWDRRGIPHFVQPHAFIPRGRLEMRQFLPDVYDALTAAGAHDVDLRRKLPPTGTVRPEDEDLQYLAVRRPVIEWALRRAVLDEPRVQVRDRVRLTGVDVSRGRVVAVRVDGDAVQTGLLVDATGRRSPVRGWLSDAGVPFDEPSASDCGVVYYSRYYRTRPGVTRPDGPWFVSPRGDLGYLGFASFPGDGDTFAALLAVPPRVREWRAVASPRAFEAAVARIPMLRTWANPEQADPITGVLAMAGLKNAVGWRPSAGPTGVLPVGDALGHTDPVLAHGLAFALWHARALVAALDDHPEQADAEAAYLAATMPELQARYALATELDAQRLRMWEGGSVDVTHRAGDYALFTVAAGGAAATVDPDVFRCFNRRMGLLDPTLVLDEDEAMQQRIQDVFEQIRATPREPLGPSRDEMLAVVQAAS